MRALYFTSVVHAILLLACLPATFVSLAPAGARAADHVIHISVDGLSAGFMQQLIEDDKAPNLKRLRDEGAWTTNARTDYTRTDTLPNHTCMFTGRPTLQPSDMPDAPYHACTTNSFPKVGASLHNREDPHVGYVASVFDVVHDAGLSTAMYATKDKFILYDQSYDENKGAPHDHGRDKIDVYFYANDGPLRFSASMNARFLADMAERRFNYVFIHYRDTDTAGHALGWGGRGWAYALRNIDGYVGEILKLIENDVQLAGRTAIILTTDHGGKGFVHDDAAVPENYTIPILVWGAGVGRGDLYAINRAVRTDPGQSRPEYSISVQPIRNGDTGNLALSLLGLGPIPGSLINAGQDLRVALVCDYNLDGAVDAADYIVWKTTEGSATDLRADGNGDGQVDQADHDLWKSHFNESAAAAP